VFIQGCVVANVLRERLILSSFFYHFQKVKDVYLKLHQIVFLTPSVAVVSASRIQFEVITLGHEDR